jgi:hypothetical protein
MGSKHLWRNMIYNFQPKLVMLVIHYYYYYYVGLSLTDAVIGSFQSYNNLFSFFFSA